MVLLGYKGCRARGRPHFARSASEGFPMGSATSHKVGPAIRPEGEQEDWPVFVCQQGAFLFDPRAYFPVDPEEAKAEFSGGVELNPRRGRVALPPCRKRDTLLDQRS